MAASEELLLGHSKVTQLSAWPLPAKLPHIPDRDTPKSHPTDVTLRIYKWALISAALMQHWFGITVTGDDCLINCLRSADTNRMDGWSNKQQKKSVCSYTSVFFPAFIESISHLAFPKTQTFKVAAFQHWFYLQSNHKVSASMKHISKPSNLNILIH